MELLPAEILEGILEFTNIEINARSFYRICLRHTCKSLSKLLSISETPYIHFLSEETNLDLIDYFIELKPRICSNDTINSFIQQDRIDYVVELHVLGAQFSQKSHLIAAGYSLESLEYMHQLGIVPSEGIYLMGSKAAATGNIEVLKCLKKMNFPLNLAVSAAIGNGQYECLKYLHVEGYHLSCSLLRAPSSINATDDQVLKCITYAYENGMKWGKDTLDTMVENGMLKCVKFMYENGAPVKQDLCNTAVYRNRFEVLKYLHSKGEFFFHGIMREACSNGNLDIIRYLHENDVPWDTFTCEILGCISVECLRYAYEHGAPWNGKITESARVDNCSPSIRNKLNIKQRIEKTNGFLRKVNIALPLPGAIEYAKELGLI